MIPCKKNKCLKYPICQSKEDIICEDLTRLLEEISHSTDDIIKYNYRYNKAWNQIRKVLPKAKSINHTDTEPYPPYRNKTRIIK